MLFEIRPLTPLGPMTLAFEKGIAAVSMVAMSTFDSLDMPFDESNCGLKEGAIERQPVDESNEQGTKIKGEVLIATKIGWDNNEDVDGNISDAVVTDALAELVRV